MFAKISKFSGKFWLSLSLAFSASYGLMAMHQAFSDRYIIQDDARQHVFWMLRYIDPNLFPNDLIANYFQSVAPSGYAWLYKIAAILTINPIVFSKIIPLLLGLICTYYLFNISYTILPIPVTGFITTLVFNQAIWMKDDIASGTPRAFVYPIFLAFLHYLLADSLLGIGIAIALLGLFYPQYVLVASALLILRLITWEKGKITLISKRQNYLLAGVGLAMAFLVLLPFALSSSTYGPSITRAQAQQLPEFSPGGRGTFFHRNPISYWFTGKRSGMFPSSLFTPVTQCAGLLLPMLLIFAKKFPLTEKITPKIWIIPQLFGAATGLFFLAHLVLFKLHLPSRYTGLSFRILIALMTGISLTLIIDKVKNICILKKNKKNGLIAQKERSLLYLSILIIMGIPLICYPLFVSKFPVVGYQRGRVPELYQFLQQQPKDTLIASLAEEANHLPTFGQRSILVGREYGIPYQIGYYRQFRQRVLDLIEAQYTKDPQIVRAFIEKYGIDLWLLDGNALTLDYVKNYGWLEQFEGVKEAIAFLQQAQTPIFAQTIPVCTIWQKPGLILLDAKCMIKSLQ